MKFKQFMEMPINNAELIGKWDKWPDGKKQDQNWDKASYNILTNDPGLEKLKNRWSKVNQTFDMYFIKKSGMRSHVEIGEVYEAHLHELGIKVPPIDRSHITVFFTNNLGDGRVPMTPWTIGHRFGHSVRQLDSYQKFMRIVENDFNELLEMIYGKKAPSKYGDYGPRQNHEKLLSKLMQAFGSMRSARDEKLLRAGEFYHELFGQFILDGQITFREDIPRMLITRYAWGNPSDGAYSQIGNDEVAMKEIVQKLRGNAAFYNNQCNRILDDCIGRIFVM